MSEKQEYKFEERIIQELYLGAPSMEKMARAAIRETLRLSLQFMDRYCNRPASKADEIKCKDGLVYETLGDVETADDLRIEFERFIICDE